MAGSIVNFLKNEIWHLYEQDLSATKALILKTSKLFLLAVQGFQDDFCRLRASALTLYTLLSIVPIIALLFGIAKGFGFEAKLKQHLLENIPEQETMVFQLLEFAENLLLNTKGGVVAGIGVVVLFWTVIKVISNIEDSFNDIWKIKQGRAWSRKISDYLSLMMLAPVLLISAGSITVFIKTQITLLMTWIKLPDFGTMLVLRALSFSPLILMGALFSFLYIFMPNHKVPYKTGILAGFITAVLYQLLQWGYLSLQLGVSEYNAIYGSFAALPLFIVWLQVGWFIVLFGCEISFYIEHYQSFKNNKHYANLSFNLEKILALRIMHFIVRNFSQQHQAVSTMDVVHQLSIPIPISQVIVQKLLNCRLIVQIKPEEGEDDFFLPAMDSKQITVALVINALEHHGVNTLPENTDTGHFTEMVESFGHLVEQSEKNALLTEIG